MSFHIIREWLDDCDANHPRCQPSHGVGIPTRLLDLGNSDNDFLRVYETKSSDTMPYVALSHPWGPRPHFCTEVSNIEKHKQEIDFNYLPATFQHAITITRNIGQRYIWIDSLCIIQGAGGDFDQEAPKMETIFSSAYCVLSASSSYGQYDGFLMKPKQNRDYLIFEREGLSPLYICRFIDDFGNDVLHSNLSRRGWAFQERALARRTVYFTNAQIYWECGNGVRCQSLAKMNK